MIPPDDSIETIRFNSEKAMIEQILSDQDIKEMAEQIRVASETDTRRRKLLASGLRITTNIMPDIFNVVQFAKEVVGLKENDVEVFVHDEPVLRATCMDFEKQGIFLTLSSGLIEKLSSNELSFIIGHELGHAVYHHMSLPVREMLDQGDKIPPDKILNMLSWLRRAEISADRVGLLCCQDIHVAGMALIKMSCGLTAPHIQFHLDDYISQMEDIRLLSASTRNVEDCFTSHPFNPLRVVALDYFWESQLLTQLLGHSPENMTEQEMDDNINSLLAFMEPESIMDPGGPVSDCLLWGGFWVAYSDEDIDIRERMSIFHLVKPSRVDEANTQLQQMMNPMATIQQNFKTSAEKCEALTLGEKHALIQKLVVVARADSVVKGEELIALKQISELLGVNPGFVDKILILSD